MDLTYENPALTQELRGASSVDTIEAALDKISRLVPTFAAPEIRGRQMFSPSLDAAIPELVRKLRLADVPGTKSNENVCIVATRFYPTGGHSKVAADIARIVGRASVSIVLTDIYRQLRHTQLMNGPESFGPFQARSLQILTAPTMIEKIIELYMALAAIRPTRIFLIQNHMDLTAVAGVWPFRDIVEFVHHADHLPTLGATLPFSAHVDLTYTCHLACRAQGLQPTWAGMTVENAGAGVPASPPASPPRRIATCGSVNKYRQPGRYRWVDFAVAALESNQAEFLHIGPVDAAFEADIGAGLTAANVDPARYKFLGAMPDLRQALIDQQVDAYLASYPESGGKAALEAMAAGVAPVVPVPDELGPLFKFDLPLDSWVRVSAPGEVANALMRSAPLSAALRSPQGRQALADEFGRFEAYIAGRPAPATT